MQFIGSDATAQGLPQPFGGELGNSRDGAAWPIAWKGGNLFGTVSYFPFFRPRVPATRLQ